jgi:hypothetical protein
MMMPSRSAVDMPRETLRRLTIQWPVQADTSNQLIFTGVEIRGGPVVRDRHFLGKDDHVLTEGSP